MNVAVCNSEDVVRLLFFHRMTSDSGVLEKEAFPADELAEVSGKSVSVDRLNLIKVPEDIDNKLATFERPEKGRSRWGFTYSGVQAVSNIRSQCGKQVFAVFEDPIENYPPAPWDAAHGKLVRANSSFSKSFVRGYRDKLVEVFQANVTHRP